MWDGFLSSCLVSTKGLNVMLFYKRIPQQHRADSQLVINSSQFWWEKAGQPERFRCWDESMCSSLCYDTWVTEKKNHSTSSWPEQIYQVTSPSPGLYLKNKEPCSLRFTPRSSSEWPVISPVSTLTIQTLPTVDLETSTAVTWESESSVQVQTLSQTELLSLASEPNMWLRRWW